MGRGLERWVSGAGLGASSRLGATARLGPACGLVSATRLGAAPDLDRALCRTAFRPSAPAALRVALALSLSRRAGSEPVEGALQVDASFDIRR